MYSDIVIIGGGASGLICAITAAEKHRNKKIIILEKQSKIGRKLMSTGNGRCNLTNINADKSYYHGSFSKYIDDILINCSVDKVLKTFSQYGLTTRTDEEGRVYPYSNHASSVLDVLKLKLEHLNIQVVCDTNVNKIRKKSGSFYIDTNYGNYKCEKVVMCTGSKASPKLGSDASGLDLLKNLGHNITPLSPALCQIQVESSYIKQLKGIRSNGKVSLISDNKIIKEESGEIQFTENSLSGICLFNLSSYLRKNKKYEIEISLLPHLKDGELLYLLKERQKNLYKYNIEEIFTGVFVRNLGVSIIKECGINLSRKISTLTYEELEKLTLTVNHRRFKVLNKLSFDKAQVVAGGVSGKEINPKTMESSIIKNLYICGEAIDINGDCGGFNLQFAFASGIIAGENL